MDKKRSRKIPIDTLKLLLARSGNQCAFPDCEQPVFDDDGLFVSQLCHIEGVSPKGQRYNANKSEEETNSYENLFFLCYRHHKVTDNVVKYTVDRLKEIKTAHEARFKEATYEYSNKILETLINETTSYWQSVEDLHTKHIAPDLKVPIDTKQDILSLIADIHNNLTNLFGVNSTLMSSYDNKKFESICLAMPNFLTRISVSLEQVEIKYIEELLLKNPHDKELVKKLNDLREHFNNTIQHAGLAD